MPLNGWEVAVCEKDARCWVAIAGNVPMLSRVKVSGGFCGGLREALHATRTLYGCSLD